RRGGRRHPARADRHGPAVPRRGGPGHPLSAFRSPSVHASVTWTTMTATISPDADATTDPGRAASPRGPDPSAVEPAPSPGSGGRRRLVAMSVWVVAFCAWFRLVGLPGTDPIQAFVWLWAATVAWRSDQPWREHLRFA